jgi:hypothetical protein
MGYRRAIGPAEKIELDRQRCLDEHRQLKLQIKRGMENGNLMHALTAQHEARRALGEARGLGRALDYLNGREPTHKSPEAPT